MGTKRRLAMMNRSLDEQWRGGEWLNGRPRGDDSSGGQLHGAGKEHRWAWTRRSVSAGHISHKAQRAVPGYLGFRPAVKAEGLMKTFGNSNREAAQLISQRRLAPHETLTVGGGPHPANALGYDPDQATLVKFSEHLSNQKKCAQQLMRELPKPWSLHPGAKLP